MMTYPPSAPPLAQLDQNLPKVRADAEGQADSRRSESNHNSTALPSRDDATTSDSTTNGIAGRVTRAPAPLDASQTQSQAHLDANDSPPGDVHSTVDSTSSHTSVTSSLFSAQHATTSSSRYNTASVTPLATRDSPASLVTPTNPTHDLSSGSKSDRAARSNSHTALASTHNGSMSSPHPTFERVPARPSGSSAKGVKSQTDTYNDRSHNNKVALKSSKPIYKTFGLVCIIRMLLLLLGRGCVIIFCENIG